MLSRTSSRVSSPVSLVVRSRASTTASAGWPSASLWSISQAARPIGESAIPYRVCGRAAMYWAYSTCLYVLSSCSYARRSSAESVDGEESMWRLQAHLIDDEGAPVAALGDVAVVTEAVHQLRPCASDVLDVP